MPQRDLALLQLLAKHLHTLQVLLAQHVPQAEVWAYGSRVMGGAHLFTLFARRTRTVRGGNYRISVKSIQNI